MRPGFTASRDISGFKNWNVGKKNIVVSLLMIPAPPDSSKHALKDGAGDGAGWLIVVLAFSILAIFFPTKHANIFLKTPAGLPRQN